MSEVAQATREPLVMFPIYDHPLDWPQHFVARRVFVFPGDEAPQKDPHPFATHMSLVHLRTMLPEGLNRIGPCEGDDPKILETWL